MNILNLPLKNKWYEMIESGIKTEEYRELKPYWTKRLLGCDYNLLYDKKATSCFGCSRLKYGGIIPKITHVRFRYGYTKRTMLREIESIKIGCGKPEWGAPIDKQVFIIRFKKGGVRWHSLTGIMAITL